MVNGFIIVIVFIEKIILWLVVYLIIFLVLSKFFFLWIWDRLIVGMGLRDCGNCERLDLKI